MKRKSFMAITLILSVFSATCATVSFAESETSAEIKNIIYMIPDGGAMDPYYLADAVKLAGGYDNREIYPYVTETGSATP